MILITFHQDDNNLTTGNYYIDALKKAKMPFVWCEPELAQEKLINNHYICTLIKIDDGHHDNFPYNEYIKNSAFVCIDTHTDFNRVKTVGQNVNYIFAAQKNAINKFDKPAIWLPSACDPNVHTSIYSSLSKRPIDIGFAGSLRSSWNARREWFLVNIYKHFKKHKLYLKQTNRGQLSLINGSSKILLNQLCNNDINMRMFETLSAGGLLISQKVENNGMEDLGLNKYCLQFSTFGECIELIEQALKDIKSFEEMACSGQEFVQKYHSYDQRLQTILDTLTQQKKCCFAAHTVYRK